MGVSLKEAEKITGLTSRQIHFYITNCDITVRVKRARGARGVKFVYLESNLIELSIIKQLTDFGITKSVIKKILGSFYRDPEYLKDYYKEFSYLYIFNKGEGEFAVKFSTEKLSDSEMEQYPSCIIIDYKRIIDRVLNI
jgi:DNA-binding transcriptional MerR regulator